MEATKPHRRRLPNERTAVTHKFDISGHEGYITVGLYPDGQPGEIFLKMAKEGSTVSGLMDTLATSVSLALQYGVPLKDVVNKFAHVRFEPSGFTGNPEIPIAKSLVDYIFRWLGLAVPADGRQGVPRADRPVGASWTRRRRASVAGSPPRRRSRSRSRRRPRSPLPRSSSRIPTPVVEPAPEPPTATATAVAAHRPRRSPRRS